MKGMEAVLEIAGPWTGGKLSSMVTTMPMGHRCRLAGKDYCWGRRVFPAQPLPEAGCTGKPCSKFEEGASLVITVGAGSPPAKKARTGGGLADLVITDHHQPQGPLPEAIAVLNPLQEDCPYRFKWLSGVGVAFKLATALMEQAGEEVPHSLLDLVALGTVADMVPLLGENRALVSLGLAGINGSPRVGLKALAGVVGLQSRKSIVHSLAFNLGPALNAAGRMGMPIRQCACYWRKPERAPRIGPVSLPTKPTPAGYGG